ncbi:tryptophan halogenase family protein [Shewanella sp. UCD-KL12]|uniref:tryptophan halogenase family protein n=1 Tax=Shewanella sp. UCD-KL12 TaxID=1917163 RepID=UPI0009709F1A|nr:tryptophan halogenase family protein [Shewanella sp. UCD-KL12]
MSASTNQIKSIIIVGGGTAGWLAANHLGRKFSTADGLPIKVTLVESPTIPNIGVGEGTVPMMRETLRYLGIDEGEFVTSCDATFKQSIKFVDWVYDPSEVEKHEYHHLFDYPTGDNPAFYWGKVHDHKCKSFAESVSIQAGVADSGLAPKLITQPQYQGITSYAYHLDATKFSELLKKNAVERFHVSHVVDDVVDVEVSVDGNISQLSTMSNGKLVADLYVDCTGFSARLIEGACKVPFVDKSDVLFVDSALAVQVPYESADSPIPCYTISSAQKAGWIWDIGLSQRRGVGYVYSSRYSTRGEAECELRKYLGVGEEVSFRHIPMKIGYRQRAWHKNCVAIGLSAGFVEPLEATGLLVFDVTSRMLAECMPSKLEVMSISAKQFNNKIANTWERVIDFIKLHYVASKRSDTAFWRDNREESSIPDSLKERLELWNHQLPNRYDFTSTLDIFNLENYLYVLYGMDFKTDLGNEPVSEAGLQMYQKHQINLESMLEQGKEALLPHRELIDKINQFGIQKV